MSLQSHNRRFRRLALERVEDRKLLAPVAFATGMENQLSAYKNDVAGGALPLYAPDPAPENWTVYKCEFSRTRVVTEADIAEVTC